MQCPICEYPQVRPRYRMRDRFFEATSDQFVLYHCPSCDSLFQDERDLPPSLAKFYPAGYWWGDGGRLSRLERLYRHWMVRQDQLRFVLQTFPQPNHRKLLDIGCGGGVFVKEAREAGFDAFGLDSSLQAARIAGREVPGRIFQAADNGLAVRAESFDVVTLFHCLEHIPDPFRYLKGLRRVLRKSGTLFVQVPNAGSYQARIFGSRWYGLDCPRHLYNYSIFSVLHLLGRAGYRIQRIRHFSLRDNAAALASSLFPALDPVSQRVKTLRRSGRERSAGLALRTALYFNLMLLAQPLAFLEARLGRGATVSICASLD